MGIYSDISNALNTRLSTLSNAPTILWPNHKANLVPGNTYLRPTLLPAQTNIGTFARSQHHKGIYQVDVFVPLEKGISTINTLLDNLETHFATDLTLSSGSHTVYIGASGRGNSVRQESHYVTYLQINYTCYQ